MLHILPELKEGGSERGVIDQVTWLKDHGVESIVVSAGGMWLDRLTNTGIRHIELPVDRKNPLTILSCAKRTSNLIRDEKIMLVCAHSRVPAWIAHIATRSGNGHDPPLIIEAEALYEPFWYSKVMCRGDRVIAVSGAIRDHMISLGCDKSRLSVVPRWVSPSDSTVPDENAVKKIRLELGIPEEAKLILGVGRITRLKGWDVLIKAIGLLPDPKSYCAIVGSAHRRKRKYLEELVSLAKNMDLENRVRFVGHRDDLDAIYRTADCVAMPSRIVEAFGLVVVEAISAGVPVIATKGCGVAEFLGDEFTNFLIPMNDGNALADKINTVLKNDSEVKTKVGIIRDRILTDLTLDRSMQATIRVYGELCPEFKTKFPSFWAADR